MREVVIVSAVRTAIGTFGGSLKNVPVTELGGTVIAEAVKRAGIGTEDLSEVIMGNILQGGLGQNPARQAAAAGGVPFEVPAMTINKVCGSGLKAVNLATQALLLGDADIIAAGGMESMSRAGFVTDKPRWGKKMGNIELIDMMINDGLWDVFNDYHMGITAENIAERWDISRAAQDEFAAGSQQKAEQAIKEGRFEEEIVPVTIPKRRGEDEVFKQDEHPRFGTTKEKLANLRPAFKKEGTVTAGNASGINDGAAALVLTTKEKAKELGLKPLAVIKSYASAAVDPEIMGIGPVPATRKALKKTDLKLEDIDLIEANEAFASQSLAVLEELKLNPEIVNVNGGAIALGHPIGASGARILVTLLHEMQKRRVEYGLATLCIGGGMGTAVIIKRSE